MTTFTRETELPVSAAAAFAWHERPGALERLLPPWESVTVTRQSGHLRAGAIAEITTRFGPLPLRWVAEHCDYDPPHQFRDVQKSGPFAKWDHRHTFVSQDDNTCTLRDTIDYRLPGGSVGNILGGRYVANRLDRMFAFRHRQTRADLTVHHKYQERKRMKIAITGATGLVGTPLSAMLTTGGHQVLKLVRRQPGDGELFWDPSVGKIDAAGLEGVDAVVHLAGENVAGGRWNAARKKRIRDSRVVGTRLLCETLAKLDTPPQVLVAASAIGFYGDRGEQTLTESSEAGDDFLASVCQEWEAATAAATSAAIRVVNLRIGVVMSPRGGALHKMLTPFKLGLGGKVGSGRQFWSWIGIDDVIGAIHHAIMSDSLSGPVNAVSPQPLANIEFTKILGRVLRRPTIFPMPAFAARLAFGEMADGLLLCSQNIQPTKLLASGYEFRHDNLEAALRHLLGR